MKFRILFKIITTFFFAFFFVFTLDGAKGADHVDAPLTTADPEVDITDVYAFVDPSDNSRVVLAMAVLPFEVPSNNPNTGFGTEVLYQFKIDNDGDAVEDLVVQVLFDGNGFNQNVRFIGPAAPLSTGAVNQILALPASIQGVTQQDLTQGNFRAYSGLADDAFVFDFTQFNAILDGSQDLFRGITSPVLGDLSGRPINPDGTSGVDFFSGVNASHIVVSFPKNLIRGDGFFGIDGLVGIWGTTSRPDQQSPNDYVQIERMGQQVFNTVFIPSNMKDSFNAAVPAQDNDLFSGLVPDALTQEDNDGTGNTIAGRVTLLDQIGVTATPNGAPLILPSNFVHPLVPTAELLRVALLPDFLRLDLDRAADELSIGLFGLQNGRRPQDDVGDIALLLVRQLADVNFPQGSMVPGSGAPRASALDCTTLPACPDRRVLVVLQGTDWIKPDDQIQALRLDKSGNDSPFPAAGGLTTNTFANSVFNFMALTIFPEQNGGGNGGSCAIAEPSANMTSSVASIFIPGLAMVFVLARRIRRKETEKSR